MSLQTSKIRNKKNDGGGQIERIFSIQHENMRFYCIVSERKLSSCWAGRRHSGGASVKRRRGRKKIELKEVGYFLAGAGKLYYIPPTYYLDTIVF
jgi:hypothetical protein